MATATHAGRHPATVTIAWIAFWLLIIGGLNWLLVGLFEFDLVAALFGHMSPAARVVYTLVGLSAIYCAYAMPAMRRRTDV